MQDRALVTELRVDGLDAHARVTGDGTQRGGWVAVRQEQLAGCIHDREAGGAGRRFTARIVIAPGVDGLRHIVRVPIYPIYQCSIERWASCLRTSMRCRE